MSETPELRAGPPWAMEEMIAAEAGLVEPVLASPAAAALAERVSACVAAGEPVVMTGCGTSEHAAMAGVAILGEALPRDAVLARDAFEASLDPQRGGVLIAVSHEAGTPATLAAARAAAGRDADVAFITARPDRAPAGALVYETPLVDRSWCHTVGYLSPMLACHAVAAHLADRPPACGPVQEAIGTALARRDTLGDAASRLARCERLLAVGSGVDEITARELALKIEEGAHVPVTPLGVEKVLHGHLPAADARTGVIVLLADPHAQERRAARAAEALRATGELGMPSVRLQLDEPAGLPPAAGALLAGALAAQLLTLELVHARGTNPDLIRRDEEPYRRAAEVAEAG
jgi:glucosamine--fructose-6-phosphate aminotransferase (isomerizing)